MMAGKDFQVEFTWQDIPYIGMVIPEEKDGRRWYYVNLESENQETFIEIRLTPSTSELQDWDFFCNGEDATEYYDNGLLEELGEAIEKHLIETNF